MALITGSPIKREIPHEPEHWIEIRKLSWMALKEARREQAAANREDMKALGAEFVAAILSGRREDEDRVRRRLREEEWDVSQFDQATLLYKGLAGWSYDAPVDRDAIGQLDAATAEWAAREILSASRPPSEADVKNGSALSTVS